MLFMFSLFVIKKEVASRCSSMTGFFWGSTLHGSVANIRTPVQLKYVGEGGRGGGEGELVPLGRIFSPFGIPHKAKGREKEEEKKEREEIK